MTGGLGRPLRDVLRDSDHDDDDIADRKRPIALFGEVDEGRIEALLGALRETLAAAFPTDAVTSRYTVDGAAPVTHLLTAEAIAPADALDLATPQAGSRMPSLRANVDLGCFASVAVRRLVTEDAPAYDYRERRLFAAIVGLVNRW